MQMHSETALWFLVRSMCGVMLTLWVACHPVGAAPQWRPATFPTILSHAAAYDELHSQLVVFGGRHAMYADYMDITWVLNGSSWELRFPNTRPSARIRHSMVYDSARKRVVLFGGNGPDGYLNDTWVWDGNDWAKQHTTVRPPARDSFALTYDAKRDVVVLFGGNGESGLLDDTWTWNGSVWALQSPKTKPPSRADHAMAWDESLGSVVLFGGSTTSGDSAETWLWNGSDWNKAAAKGPSERWGHSLAFDAAAGRVVLFGGYSGGYFDDTWIWKAGVWTRYEQPPSAPRPAARTEHAATYDTARRQVIVVGGNGSKSPLDDAWAFGASGWVSLAPSANPKPRSGHAMAYDAARREVILFGGDSEGDETSETWAWNGTQWVLRSPSSKPTPMAAHAMAYDAARQEVILFGGEKGETWGWNGATWAQKQTSVSPPALYYPVMAYDAARDRVVLFGGNSIGGVTGETWTWDGAKWQRMNPAVSPPERTYHAMAYDAERRAVVLYGGMGYSANPLADTWSWDGVNWSRLSPAISPPAMDGCSMIYDSTSRVIVLQGQSGYGGPDRNETWIWNGTTWSAAYSTDVPPLSSRYTMAYDDEHRQLLLYGGRTGGGNRDSGDTWIWKEWQSTPSEGPLIASVVNAASYTPGIVDGSWLSILGANLSSSSRPWRGDEIVNGSLPTTLDGVRVLIDGLPAAISYISPTQLNVQAPITGKAGDVVDVIVTTAKGTSASTGAEVKTESPGIFVFSQGEGRYPAGLVARSDGNVDYLGPVGLFGSALASRPAKPGETISLYATGLGPTSPLVPAGQVFSGAAPLVGRVTCKIAHGDAPVTFAGMVGVGLYQLNVKVPNVGAGDQLLFCDVNGTSIQGPLLVAVGN